VHLAWKACFKILQGVGIRRKTLYIKIKDKNPSIKSTRQMRALVNTTQRKKMEANNQRKIRKRKPYANSTQGYKMTINNNKEDLRREISYLPQID
jgi:hypothetical protein